MPAPLIETARRAARPIPAVDGPTRRAWTATQPGRRSAANLVGWQFLVAAAAAAAVATGAPHAIAHTGSFYAIAAACFGVGVFLRFSIDAGELSIDRAITAAILLVSATVMLARPMELTPILLLWPLTLSAHFALPGRFATNVALALIALAASLFTAADTTQPAAALVLFAVVAIGTSVAYRRLRAEAARLFGELEELSSRDALTGALNRAAFERAFTAWVGNGMNRRLESSLLLLDIDDFARLNAEHGYEAGERALRQLSEIVDDCIRETDAFGRLKGDDFALLFPATSGHEALIAAERIRSAVARRSAEAGVAFTISIGLTSGHASIDPWTTAQRALRLAKEAGGNHVTLAGAEAPLESMQLLRAA
ncbi:MAG: GGDEF domain-containing protein [Solirubrobacteraceae bacterium]|nr:GGDEF domain-containing protein [Solirubrobacteraceae bacterium]